MDLKILKGLYTMTIKEVSMKLVNRYIKMIGQKDQHLRNMCLTLVNKMEEWPIDKSSRWLGFIQCGVINLKLTTVKNERDFSRPLFHKAYTNENTVIPQVMDVQSCDTQLATFGKIIVLFIHDNSIIHLVAFEEQPNVATLSEIFNELSTDEEFGLDEEMVKTLKVDIMTMENYITQYGNIEFGIDV